jgi:branched-chain amino acid transport system permease protein
VKALANSRYVGLGVLAVFFVVAWFVVGGLDASAVSIAVLALYYGAAGTSFNFLYGSIGVFSLAQPVFLAVGGYTGVYLYLTYGISPWLSIPISCAVAGLIALPIGLASLRRPGAVMTALVTLIIAEAAGPVVSAIKPLGGSIGLYLTLRSSDDLGAMQFGSGVAFARIFLIVNVILIAGLMWFNRSRAGYWARALRDSPEAADACGVPVFRVKLWIFVASAMIAAPVGLIYAQYNLLVNTDLFLGTTTLFEVIVVALVGGVARSWGTLVGALAIVEISQNVTSATSSRPGYGPLTFACIFLVIALLMPRGLSGTWAAWWERRRRSPDQAGGIAAVGAPQHAAERMATQTPVPDMTAHSQRSE